MIQKKKKKKKKKGGFAVAPPTLPPKGNIHQQNGEVKYNKLVS